MNTNKRIVLINEEAVFFIFGLGPSASGNTRVKAQFDLGEGRRATVHCYMKPDGTQHLPNKKIVHTVDTISPANPENAEKEFHWAIKAWKNNPGTTLAPLKGAELHMARTLAIAVWNEWAARTKSEPQIQYKPAKQKEVLAEVPVMKVVHPSASDEAGRSAKFNQKYGERKPVVAKKKEVVKNDLDANNPGVFDQLLKRFGAR